MLKNRMIKILVLLLIMFYIMTSVTFADDRVFYKKKGQDHEENAYKVYYRTKSGENKLIWEVPKTPIINELKNNLVQVLISCGTSCSYSKFVNIKTGEISKRFFLVLAVESKQRMVAVPDENTVLVYKIFNSEKELIKIKRNFAPSFSVASIIKEVKFMKNNKLYIRYLSLSDKAEEPKEKEEIIKIPKTINGEN